MAQVKEKTEIEHFRKNYDLHKDYLVVLKHDLKGETPTPDVSFNTGTAPEDATLTLKLGITSGQVFDNYRFRLMVHNKSNDIGYVNYRKETVGTMVLGANEKAYL